MTQHLIWDLEWRYHVAVSERTDTKRRLYFESDIERLQMVEQVVESGHSINAWAVALSITHHADYFRFC